MLKRQNDSIFIVKLMWHWHLVRMHLGNIFSIEFRHTLGMAFLLLLENIFMKASLSYWARTADFFDADMYCSFYTDIFVSPHTYFSLWKKYKNCSDCLYSLYYRRSIKAISTVSQFVIFEDWWLWNVKSDWLHTYIYIPLYSSHAHAISRDDVI